jgi:hypothetical protein
MLASLVKMPHIESMSSVASSPSAQYKSMQMYKRSSLLQNCTIKTKLNTLFNIMVKIN